MGKSLQECPVCGSTEFCVESPREDVHEFVVCRNCDYVYGVVNAT